LFKITDLIPTTLAFLFFLSLGFFARHNLEEHNTALGTLSDSELLLALPALGATEAILKDKYLTVAVHRLHAKNGQGDQHDLCQLQIQVKNIATLHQHLLVTISHREARRLFQVSAQQDQPIIVDTRLHRIPNCHEKISYGL
jgi:hypothetical protein